MKTLHIAGALFLGLPGLPVAFGAPQLPGSFYELQPGSFVTLDCPVCELVTNHIELGGTFHLSLEQPHPEGALYGLSAIDFAGLKVTFDFHVSGEGQYLIRSDGTQSLILDLTLNGGNSYRLAGISAMDPSVTFPDIVADAAGEHSLGYHLESIHLAAVPTVPPLPKLFRRGDVNGDGAIEVADALGLLFWVFLRSFEPGCLEAADVDADGTHALADAVFLLIYAFQGGAAPPAPGPQTCGEDPDPTFDCERQKSCPVPP